MSFGIEERANMGADGLNRYTVRRTVTGNAKASPLVAALGTRGCVQLENTARQLRPYIPLYCENGKYG